MFRLFLDFRRQNYYIFFILANIFAYFLHFFVVFRKNVHKNLFNFEKSITFAANLHKPTLTMKIYYRKIFVILFLLCFLTGMGICAIGLVYYKFGFISNPLNCKQIGQLPPPPGYTRVKCDDESFGAYLRQLPLKRRGSRVHLYKSDKLARFQGCNYAVVDMPLLSNYEQCADVCMRLRAEYLYSSGQYQQIRFQALDGSILQYKGGNDREAFERFMRRVYGICNTTSMCQSMPSRPLGEVQIGDVFVYSSRSQGVYGHAVMVVDVAQNVLGKKVFLVVEGNTPAREMHVLRNPYRWFMSAWYTLNADGEMQVVSPFRFYKNELRHW